MFPPDLNSQRKILGTAGLISVCVRERERERGRGRGRGRERWRERERKGIQFRIKWKCAV